MRVTVTGANGFIGRHLVMDQVARGRSVCAVDVSISRLGELKTHPSVQLVDADVRDADSMRKAVAGSEVVFHLASAHLSVALSEKDYREINRDASERLVRLCREAGVRRFVHCSSVGVYGEIRTPPADEDSPCHPDLVYERTKLEGEEAIRKFAGETGYPVVVVRPVWVYGPGCPRTEKLFRTIRKGRFFYVGDGSALRHCIYISDMVDAFNLCADTPAAAGRVYVIGDRSAVTIRELIRTMAVTAGVPEPRLSLPFGLVNSAFRLIEAAFAPLRREPPVSRRSLKFFTNNTAFDISRSRKELGFEPKIGLEEGMRLTFEAMRHPPRPAEGKGV